MIGTNCSGPKEQLAPMISAPIASKMMADDCGSVPVTVLPSSLKDN